MPDAIPHRNVDMQEALVDVVHTSQRLLTDRINLLQHDAQLAIRQAIRRSTAWALVAMCGLGVFVALSIALGMGLAEIMPGYQAAALVALTHAALAGGAAVYANRQTQDVKGGPSTP